MLFKTIDEVREYISVNISSDIETLKPYIRLAESEFIKPVIGKVLLKSLQDYYDSEASGSSEIELWDELLAKVQLPLINYAYNLYVPIGQVQVSDAGIHITSNDTKKTAFQWQVEKVEKAWLNTAHNFMEDLLEFLDENKDTFTDWSGSAEYDAAHSLFINSAKEFNEEFFINKSRRLFVHLIPIIKSVEKKFVYPTLGKDYYDELKDLILGEGSGDISDDDQVIIDKIKPAVAHITISRAISELGVEILPDGIFEAAVIQNGSMESQRTAATAENKNELRGQLLDEGQSELREVQMYLDANASETKYATYFGSDKYVAPVDGVNRGEFVNDSTKGINVF
jgi:hypothetical protein